MILIVCVDDGMGMSFFGKRQSRDSFIIKDIEEFTSGAKILCSPYSDKILAGANHECSRDYLEKAGENDYCFVENDNAENYYGKIKKIVLYKWNRDYPRDLCFDYPIDKCELESVTEFSGTSHEKITREVYIVK